MTTSTASHAVASMLDSLCGQYLQGKEEVLRLSLIALLADGHILIEDLPGLGKTTLVLALARSTGLSFGHVQCTSDLLPSDPLPTRRLAKGLHLCPDCDIRDKGLD